jgi:hypothetical protein
MYLAEKTINDQDQLIEEIKDILFESIKNTNGELGVLTCPTCPGCQKFVAPKACNYCPKEVNKQEHPNIPRSYISPDPACVRAVECLFSCSYFSDKNLK